MTFEHFQGKQSSAQSDASSAFLNEYQTIVATRPVDHRPPQNRQDIDIHNRSGSSSTSEINSNTDIRNRNHNSNETYINNNPENRNNNDNRNFNNVNPSSEASATGGSATGGDASARTGPSSASIQTNERNDYKYEDNSVFVNPVQAPNLVGDGIKVYSSVTTRDGSNTISVDSGVDSGSFGFGVGVPGIGGLSFGGGSANIPDQGRQEVESAGNQAAAQTALFWGQSLARRESTNGIGQELMNGGAQVLNQELRNTQSQQSK